MSNDLFGYTAPQGDLFTQEPARNPGLAAADPHDIRTRLHKMLSEARAATSAPPWNERTTRLYQLIFPQMTDWLPKEEAEQLRHAFLQEMQRLTKAA